MSKKKERQTADSCITVVAQHETSFACFSFNVIMFSSQQETDSNLALKINKGLSMGYDYQLIKTVLEQQTDDDDISKFIETMVRTAETNQTTSLSIVNTQYQTENVPVHDVYIIDGADLAFR